MRIIRQNFLFDGFVDSSDYRLDMPEAEREWEDDEYIPWDLDNSSPEYNETDDYVD